MGRNDPCAADADVTPGAKQLLDVGCGAGNYTLKLLQAYPDRAIDCDLLDLSRPMLDRAAQRVAPANHGGKVITIQSDIRAADLGEARYDVIVAAQCLHHLRGDDEWVETFAKLYRALTLGGSLWISDSVAHELPGVTAMIRKDWIDELTRQGGAVHAEKVMAYVDYEDTPRPLRFQLELLKRVGFHAIDVLHANVRFASFGGVK